jgi:hypothetical protein
MLTHEPHVSLADLLAAGVAIHHVAAVTIVREVALRVSRGELPGVPSTHVIRLTPSGALAVEGPVAAGGGAAHAAHLLDTLLRGLDVTAEHRAPGALRLLLARALGTLDLPPYPSLESFAQALSRFASPDLEATVRELIERRSPAEIADPASHTSAAAPVRGASGWAGR